MYNFATANYTIIKPYYHYKTLNQSMKESLLNWGVVCAALVCTVSATAENIQEKVIYSTDFSEWTDVSASSTVSTRTVKNKYTKEEFEISYLQTAVKHANDQTKLTGATGGYMQAAKNADDSYIMTSTLPYVTKVHFMHGATGSNRGYKLECKGEGDTDWVTLSSDYASTASGTDVTVDVMRKNVQLRFTNLTVEQNAYLLKLFIYSNVDMDNVAEREQYTLTYYDVDGTTVLGTQTVEEDKKIDSFPSGIKEKVTVAEGKKFRGWCKEFMENPEKYSTEDVVTGNLSLYALVTDEEKASTTARYDYNLKSANFTPDDHEAISMNGGSFHDATHGWSFSASDNVKVLMGGKGYVKLGLCKYSGEGTTMTLTSPNGTTVASVDAQAASDGAVAFLENTSTESGEYTLSFSGTTYVHNLSIINSTEPAYAKDGNWYTVRKGDAKSLITTIEMVSAANAAADAERSYIYVPDGTYDLGETVLTTVSGNNISIVGQSMDKTIIVNKPDFKNEGIGTTATIYNTSKNLYIQDLTLQNALEYYKSGSAGRAVCLQDRGTNTICKNVKMLSYQDTYYSNEPNGKGQFYFEDSEIHGTVDYVCGGGDVYFNRVLFVNESRSETGKSGEDVIAAPNSKSEWGYIFKDCTIENKAASFSLGRSWNNITRLTWLNTTVNQKDEILNDGTKYAYFTINAMGDAKADKFRFDVLKDAEGNKFSPSELKVIFKDSKGANPKEEENIVLTAEEAAAYSLDKVFTDWTPATLAAQKTVANAKISNTTLTWEGDAAKYLIQKNGESVALTSEKSYTIDDATAKWSVRAANEMGGLGEATVATVATGIEEVTASEDAAVVSTAVYAADGVQVSALQRGLNIVVKTMADGSKKTEKVIVK